MKRWITMVVCGVLACGAVFVTGTAVSAAEATRNTVVSCDGKTVQTALGITVVKRAVLNVSRSTTVPASSVTVWAYNAETGVQLSSGTNTASWNVAAGPYNAKFVRIGAANCNGIGFGHGNFSLAYRLKY